jgi:hypothetical protein
MRFIMKNECVAVFQGRNLPAPRRLLHSKRNGSSFPLLRNFRYLSINQIFYKIKGTQFRKCSTNLTRYSVQRQCLVLT